jgi:hypothetical protein
MPFEVLIPPRLAATAMRQTASVTGTRSVPSRSVPTAVLTGTNGRTDNVQVVRGGPWRKADENSRIIRDF